MFSQKKFGIIAGSFDIIHPGYLQLFDEGSRYCDELTIALQTDPTIERPEKLKPIFSYKDRENMLRSIRYIQNVISYTTEEDLTNILKTRKYNVRILGDDYKYRYATGQEYSQYVIYVDRSHGWSTTKYKKLIAESLNGENK